MNQKIDRESCHNILFEKTAEISDVYKGIGRMAFGYDEETNILSMSCTYKKENNERTNVFIESTEYTKVLNNSESIKNGIKKIIKRFNIKDYRLLTPKNEEETCKNAKVTQEEFSEILSNLNFKKTDLKIFGDNINNIHNKQFQKESLEKFEKNLENTKNNKKK